MKKIVLSLTLFSLVALTSFAQTEIKPETKEKTTHPRIASLNLSDQQKKQVDALRNQYNEKHDALDIQFSEGMKRILTPEQFSSYDSKEKRRSENKRNDNKHYAHTKQNRRHNHRGWKKKELTSVDKVTQGQSALIKESQQKKTL